MEPNYEEDTEWNDALRAQGIIGPKQPKEAEITEEQIQAMIDQTIAKRTDLAEGRSKQMDDMNLDELDELEDSEDEEVLERYRQKRMAEMRAFAEKSKFGTLAEITGCNYVDEVTKAGEDIWVVLHLYANGVPMCALINHHLQNLAVRYPQTKFLRSIATTCIPNFPEKNCPTIFVYFEGDVKKRFIGSLELRGDKLTLDELEFLLGQAGAVPTEIKEDPRPKIKDKLMADLEEQIDFY